MLLKKRRFQSILLTIQKFLLILMKKILTKKFWWKNSDEKKSWLWRKFWRGNSGKNSDGKKFWWRKFCKFCLCVCLKFKTYSLCSLHSLLIWWTFLLCAVIFCDLNCIEIFWFDVEVSFLPNYKLFGVRAFSILLGYTYGDMVKHELRVASYELPATS